CVLDGRHVPICPVRPWPRPSSIGNAGRYCSATWPAPATTFGPSRRSWFC
ncbi:hypothetical protein AVDCRST_MAG82-1006, partial [uncultured Rubrobacteraceae bacterium]